MKNKITLLTLFILIGLSGCVVVPAPVHRPYYAEPVVVAPPAPRVEYYGAPPVTGQIWIGGFWNWVGNRHEWVPGHWEAPRPGYRWVPHRWDQDGDRWRLQGGRWEEHREHEHGERRDWR